MSSAASPATPTTPTATMETTAWWRLPIVWMVIGGPAVVVVASFVTLALAILNPDPVISAGQGAVRSEMPAEQARNHAASPKR